MNRTKKSWLELGATQAALEGFGALRNVLCLS